MDQRTRVSKPFWRQKTALSVIGGILLTLPTLLASVVPDIAKLLPVEKQLTFLAVAGIIGKLAAAFARAGGVDAANEVGERAGVVPPVIPGGGESSN